MTAIQILMGLERSDAAGREADAAARMGFLEWAFALPGEATPEAARAAHGSCTACRPASAAAQAFVAYLQQAGCRMHRPVRRGRAARLH
ncbi:hypothetical protein DC366_02340 [Pelagivirga sediminicola]|uniref:Uncharacterized protein n=1 Tax=Pelagivirga sediminicola TaxID=2170575 RepID=A0A2T7GBQ2_9RHOB|nr:hypothetical protein [Pelagivirga sediminicola]PVA11808.1 hypothetical protein DC366_02340 [Pelagivirga sediminicola]